MDAGNDLLKNFTENGFVIKDVATFAKEADGVDLNELIRNLTELKEKMSKGTNINGFYSELNGKLVGLKAILNKDEYYLASDSKSLEDSLGLLTEKTRVASNYAKAERNMNFQKENMYAEMRAIYELGKRDDLTDELRTEETLRLYDRKKKCEDAYRDAMKFYYEQKKLYEDSLKDFDLTSFKNELLSLINKIDDNGKRLALSPETKTEFASRVNEIRMMIATFGLETVQSKNEFDRLCNKYGLKSTDKQVIRVEKEEKKEKVEKKEKGITSKEELIEKIKELNSDKELTVNDKGNLVIDGDIESIKLPDGFKLNDNTITNALSVSNSNDVISVGVEKVEKKEKGITSKEELVEKIKELNPDREVTVDDKGQMVVDGGLDDIKVPDGYKVSNGAVTNALNAGDDEEVISVNAVSSRQRELAHEPRRWKVKGQKGAIIAPYGKAILIGGGIGAVISTIGTSLITGGLVAAGGPVALGAGVVATLGGVCQKIYKKACLEGRVDIEKVNDIYGTHSEDALFSPRVVGSEIKRGFGQLMTGFKSKMSSLRKKKDEPVKEVEEPEIVPTPEVQQKEAEKVEEVEEIKELPEAVKEEVQQPEIIDADPIYTDGFAPFDLSSSLEEGLERGGR